MFKSEDIDRLRHILRTFGSFVLVTHVNPDGDAIGSMQGFATFLRVLGRRVHTITPNAYPDFLSFLDGPKGAHILIYKYHQKVCERLLSEADVIVCLDMNRTSRMETLGSFITKLDHPKVLIDHHPDPEHNEFDLIFSNPQTSSTCEWIYRIICALDMVSPFPQAVVEPLFAGIMADTNNFSNSVSADTLDAAAECMRLGVDKERVQQQIFGNFSEDRMRLMGYAVHHQMVVVQKYRAAYIMLSLKEQEQFNFRIGDTEGFVNIPLSIKGVDLSMLFVETPDYIRVSLRSQNGVDVNEMAKKFFNGGGHRSASGGKLFCPLVDLPDLILHALKESFEEVSCSLA
ncbi:MAG: bifunctional oligoribonuclease/PAP phosphatase NrnA [Prevotellaceae bacterium]|nr:bifunctional oligoribonuclease/PAP phosphatase NrnA [Prevotellaceae bacterium]